MKSLTNYFNVNFAFQANMKALASLCAFGLLASCDKKGEIPDSKFAMPSTSAAERSESDLAGKKNIVYDLHNEKPEAVFTLLKEKPEAINYMNVRIEAVKTVKEIGERKQVEVISSLLGAMFIILPFSTNNPADFSETYPCSEALIKIGEPAVPKVQDQFLIAKSGVEQLVLLHVLLKINGVRFTADWLEELQGMKLVPERRQRLAELRTWVLSQN